MKRILLAISVLLVSCINAQEPPTDSSIASQHARYEQALVEVKTAPSELERFYAMDRVLMLSSLAEDLTVPEAFAKEILGVAEKYRSDWNYGNAIHHANIVLGRVALKNGNVSSAKSHLVAACQTPGSPQLNSFGPNMSLAKELLKAGERDAVLQYLDLCLKFWKMGQQKAASWKGEINAGKIPQFEAHLIY